MRLVVNRGSEVCRNERISEKKKNPNWIKKEICQTSFIPMLFNSKMKRK